MSDHLRLRVLSARAVEVDEEVDQVTVEAVDGSFSVLPRHLDVVAPLAIGLLTYRIGDNEHVIAVDGGTLVKQGPSVDVATPRTVRADTTEELEHALRATFEDLDEHERRSRTALARLESDVVGRLIEARDRR